MLIWPKRAILRNTCRNGAEDGDVEDAMPKRLQRMIELRGRPAIDQDGLKLEVLAHLVLFNLRQAGKQKGEQFGRLLDGDGSKHGE